MNSDLVSLIAGNDIRLRIDEEGRVIGTSFLFRKYPHVPDNTNEFRAIVDIFTLKEYFIHMLEEPVDDITWLRFKQSGTYTKHFDCAGHNSFSFG